MELEKKYEEVRNRIKQIPLEMNSAGEKIMKARADLAGIEERVLAAREKRQSLLARGGNAGAITLEIRKIQEERELGEDLISGLLNVIDGLNIEMKKHIEDLPSIARDLFRVKVQELFARYNKAAQEVGKVLEDIDLLSTQYGQGVFGVSRPEFSSSELPRRIPRFFSGNEARDAGDFFNYANFSEWVRKELRDRDEKNKAQGKSDVDVLDLVREIREGRAGSISGK